MAIDTTYVNNEQTPPRWRVLATHLVGTDTVQFNALNADDKTFFQYIYDNVPATGSPQLEAGVASISVGVNAVIGFSSSDPDAPFLSYYSISDIVNYGVTVTNVPTDAATLVANSNWKFTIANAGFTAGKHIKAMVRLNDAELEGKGDKIIVDIIVPPATPATFTAADGVGQSVCAWTNSTGAASYLISYKIGSLVYTNAQILASPTGSKVDTDGTPNTVTGLAAGAYSFCIQAVNPGGTSAATASDGATIT
jgi:hypothetical protein